MRPEAAQVETGLQPRGPLIELVGVEKVYRTGKVEFPALRGIDLTIDDGEMAITMGILERTREIGTLRCIGARARDIRRIFATEGMVVALMGWLLGLPAGYLLARGIIALTSSVAHIDLSFAFPTANVAITLVGTIVLSLLVPVRRAVRFKPGEALRYA